jgi:hypothetical protein
MAPNLNAALDFVVTKTTAMNAQLLRNDLFAVERGRTLDFSPILVSGSEDRIHP